MQVRWFPSEGYGRESVPCLSPRWFTAIFGIPLHGEASPLSGPSSSRDFLPVCTSVSKFPLFLRTPVVLESGAHPTVV